MPRLLVTAILLIVALSLLAGCQNGGPSAPPGEAPAWVEVRDAQQSRLEKLERLESSGVVELRWVDEDGEEHFEPQVDMKLLLLMPDHFFVRIYKFEPLLVLGSNEENYWLLDFLNKDESVAHIGARAAIEAEASGEPPAAGHTPGAGAGAEAEAGIFHPARLLDLMGLTELPDDAAVEWDTEEEAWRVEADGRGGPMRLYLDRTYLWPVRIDSLDSAGEVIFQSRLSRYEPVEAEGMPPSGFPRFPRRVALTDIGGGGDADITFDGPTTIVDPQKVYSATDLQRLLSLLKPDRIEHVGGANDE